MMRKRNEFSREETLELERKEKEAKEEERKRQHENESTNKEFNYSNSIMIIEMMNILKQLKKVLRNNILVFLIRNPRYAISEIVLS